MGSFRMALRAAKAGMCFQLVFSMMVSGYRARCTEQESLRRGMMRLRASGSRAKKLPD